MRSAAWGLVALLVAGPGLVGVGLAAPGRGETAAPGRSTATPAEGSARAVPRGTPAAAPGQDLPFHDYDASWTFVRIQTRSRFSGFGGGRFRRFSGWAHDYPDAERNFSMILSEFTHVDTRLVDFGGNVLTFDDPRLHQFPVAYVSEPGEWRTNEEEAAGLREYLLKGGFVIFDDFFQEEMRNVMAQTALVLPELQWLPMDGTEEIWDSFFRLEPLQIVLTGPRKNGTPAFWGLWEDNDKRRRLLAIANAGADVGDLWEWSDRGFFPVDPTNEAYRIGINYIVYALTH